ncbi:MAG TPA: NAD(P)H-hydrate dehydratase, partial [Candidatus Saccharimonadia bacterium]|nr:NAD(P)H-hydrate dehydratase [Candidatus Saccharimonadia bacterium]
PDGQVFEDLAGGPELATAGTGDVLSGMIGDIIAQKIQPLEAAKAAVHLHGLAGKLAADAKTEPGTIASDVIESIPAALKLVMGSEL